MFKWLPLKVSKFVSLQVFKRTLFLSDYFCNLTYHFLSFYYQQKQPPEVFCKKVAVKKFVILTGKHLSWDFFLIKFQVFRSPGWQLYQIESPTQVFFCKYCENIQFEKHLLMNASASKVSYLCSTTVMSYVLLY